MTGQWLAQVARGQPRLPGAKGSCQRVGMSRSLGRAAAALLHGGCGAGSSLRVLGMRGRMLGWQRLLGTPGHIREEGQGGGLPQGDTEQLRAASARPWCRSCSSTASMTTWPTTFWMTASSGKALKTTPPSRKCTSTVSSWGAVTMHQNRDLVEELKKLEIRSARLDKTNDQDSNEGGWPRRGAVGVRVSPPKKPYPFRFPLFR